MVARMKRVCAGGSSSVLRKALQACSGDLMRLIYDVDL